MPAIRTHLENKGIHKSHRSNIILITLGGFSPKADKWDNSINVIAINNNDPIPSLHGWKSNFMDLKLSNHPVTAYYPILELLANPNNNLSALYGKSFKADQ